MTLEYSHRNRGIIPGSTAPHAGLTAEMIRQLHQMISDGTTPEWLIGETEVEVTEGAVWDVQIDLEGEKATFHITVPPGGTAYVRGELTASDTLTTLDPGVYTVTSSATATALGLPPYGGTLTLADFGPARLFANYTAVDRKFWSFGNKDTGTWVSWRELATTASIPDPYWKGSTQLPTDANLETLPPGVYTIWGAAEAAALGLPGSGVLTVANYGTGDGAGYLTLETHQGQAAIKYITRRGAWGISPWRRFAMADEIRQPEAPRGMRTAPLALTLGGGGADAPVSQSVRFPVHYAAPITRWRVHIQNINPRFAVPRTGAVSFTGLWIGDQQGTNGHFTAAPQRIADAFTTPADGSAWVSRWQTAPIGSGARKLLSFGYTAPSAPWQLVGGCWTTSAPGDASATAPSVTARQNAPFSIWIEAETYAQTPVIAAAGDSLSCGVGATLPVHDSPISVYARAHGALPVHYAASGDAMSASVDSSHFKWTQYADTDSPDSILWCMGSNDAFGSGRTLAEMQARHAAYGEVLASITPNLYAATITPRTNDASTQESVRRAYNTWLATHPNGIRDLFDFAGAISGDDETIDPAFDADGIHLTTAGYAAEADAIVRPICAPAPSYA